MSKIRLYLEPQYIEDSIRIKNREHVHKLKGVLRLKEKDKVLIFDGEGSEYLFRIEELKRGELILKKDSLARYKEKKRNEIILGFPFMRESKIDFVLQKATELGVDCFIPFISKRCVVKKRCVKLSRWRKIITEATRQSDRTWIPRMENVMSFKEITSLNYKIKLFATPEGGKSKDLLTDSGFDNIFVIVGPEGDFSPQEFKSLEEGGFKGFRLSSNILRTETAATFAVGLIRNILDEG